MALSQINKPAPKPKKSALETFASVLGIGTGVADLADTTGLLDLLKKKGK